jgi:hypothetical protein
MALLSFFRTDDRMKSFNKSRQHFKCGARMRYKYTGMAQLVLERSMNLFEHCKIGRLPTLNRERAGNRRCGCAKSICFENGSPQRGPARQQRNRAKTWAKIYYPTSRYGHRIPMEISNCKCLDSQQRSGYQREPSMLSTPLSMKSLSLKSKFSST